MAGSAPRSGLRTQHSGLDGWHGIARRLMLNGHTDPGGVAGMSGTPFGAVERAGRLYGRGAIDMKGGVGAILAAGATLAARPVRPRGTLLLAFSADEEYASVGSEAL